MTPMRWYHRIGTRLSNFNNAISIEKMGFPGLPLKTIHHKDAEFTWFDRLTMSGGKPLTLSVSKGSAVQFPSPALK